MNKKIFLIDSLGALISAIMLLAISQFERHFGISENLALILIPLPITFSVFSFLSYKFGKKNWKLLLNIIALVNLLYCCLTFYLTLTNLATLKHLGITYFFVEIFIIILLAIFELKIANKQDE
ncbi:MAG: hypothetical protein R2831_10645 [Chitinophagaceae bacterium]